MIIKQSKKQNKKKKQKDASGAKVSIKVKT